MAETKKGGGFPAGSCAYLRSSDFLAGRMLVAEGRDRKSPKMEGANAFAAEMARDWEADFYIPRAIRARACLPRNGLVAGQDFRRCRGELWNLPRGRKPNSGQSRPCACIRAIGT